MAHQLDVEDLSSVAQVRKLTTISPAPGVMMPPSGLHGHMSSHAYTSTQAYISTHN